MPKKRLRYNGPSSKVEIAETGQLVERGGTVVVDEELAGRLLEQGAQIELGEDDDGNPTRTVTRLDSTPWSAAGGAVPADDDEEGSA